MWHQGKQLFDQDTYCYVSGGLRERYVRGHHLPWQYFHKYAFTTVPNGANLPNVDFEWAFVGPQQADRAIDFPFLNDEQLQLGAALHDNGWFVFDSVRWASDDRRECDIPDKEVLPPVKLADRPTTERGPDQDAKRLADQLRKS